jgi:UBX domain-containing protein 1
VNIALDDKSQQEYVAPAYTAFSGGGNTMVSADTNTDGIVASAASDETAVAPVVDESKPTGAIQVRLIDGKKMVVKLNLSHTVADLVAYINANGGNSAPYFLAAGFPPKKLTDFARTIEEEGLKGGVVTQKKA